MQIQYGPHLTHISLLGQYTATNETTQASTNQG